MLKLATRVLVVVTLGVIATLQLGVVSAQAAPTVSIRLATGVPVLGETSQVAGAIGAKAATTVYPQRWDGRKWVSLPAVRSSGQGYYAFSFKATQQTQVRAYVPGHRIGRTSFPARVSAAVSIAPVRQTMSLLAQTTPVAVGQAIPTRVQVTPTRPGRLVELEWSDGTRWTRVATLPQSTAGRVHPSFVMPAGSGPVLLRAVTRPQGGAGTAVSPVVTLNRFVAPAQDDSFLSVVEKIDQLATSADGNVVAFSGLPATPTTGVQRATQVYVHERLTRETRLVSVDASGAVTGSPSLSPTVSADGSIVAFVTESAAVAQQPRDTTTGTLALVVHDVATRRSRTVTAPGRVGWPEQGERPSLSADGNRVAFRGWFVNAERSSRSPYLAVVDLPTGELTTSQRPAWNVAISGNGRYVAYDATTPMVWPGETWERWVSQVFRFDVETGTDVLVSRTPSGTASRFPSTVPSIDGSGNRIAFLSEDNEVQGVPVAERNVNVVVADLSTATYRWRGGDIVRARAFGAGPLLSADGTMLSYVAHPGTNQLPRLAVVRVTDGARVEQPVHPTAVDRRYLTPVAVVTRPDGTEVLTVASGVLERVLVPLR